VSLLLLVKTRFPRRLRCKGEEEEKEGEAVMEASLCEEDFEVIVGILLLLVLLLLLPLPLPTGGSS